MDDFTGFLKSVLAPKDHPEDDTVAIRVMPTTEVKIKKSALTEENKKSFIIAMSKIPNIHKGLSYKSMARCDAVTMSEPAAIMCQAVGRAFKVWTLIPMDFSNPEMQKSLVDEDLVKALPMNSGLNPRGVQID